VCQREIIINNIKKYGKNIFLLGLSVVEPFRLIGLENDDDLLYFIGSFWFFWGWFWDDPRVLGKFFGFVKLFWNIQEY
jgi:hypothetical protein